MLGVRGLRSGATGVLDQVVLSGTNLAIGLALAREQAPEVFGAYAVAFAAYLMGLSFQVSLITDPLVILGARRAADHQRAYFAALVRLQTGLSLALSVLVAVLALGLSLVSGSTDLVSALGGLGIALAPIQIQAFLRSVFLARFRPGATLLNDSIHCGLRLAGIPVLMAMGALTPFWVFSLHALASTISILVAVPLIKDILTASPLPHRSVVKEHWDYGRWMLATSGAHWLSGQAPLVFVSGLLSPLAAAVIKACQYLVSPMNVILTGLDGILAPRASRLGNHGADALNRFLWRLGILATAGSFFYALILLPISRPVMDFLYRGRYSDYTSVVVILLADTILRGMTRAPVLRMRVIQDTRRIFIASAWSAAVGLCALALLAPTWGVIGAAMAVPISSLALLVHLIAIPGRPTRMTDGMERQTTTVASS